MVAPVPDRALPGVCSQLGNLALRVALSPLERADAIVDRLLVLDGSAGAVDLRLGRLLCWFLHADLSPLGYSTYGAFVTEWVDLGSSQLSALVRLANSELYQVKQALCANRITTTQAVQAVRDLGRCADALDQDNWLECVLDGGRWIARTESERTTSTRTESARTDPAPRRVRVEGKHLKAIHKARRLAALVVGRELSPATADKFVLDHWRAGTRGTEILDEGRQPRPAPEPAGPWPELDDPATAVLGPWEEPRDLQHAIALLKRVLAARRGRAVERGRLYLELVENQLYRQLGFSSVRELTRETLRVSQRTLQDDARLAQELDLCPGLADAIAQGLDLDRALLVLDICDDDTAEEWIDVARRTGKRSLRALVKLAQEVGDRAVLEATRQAREQADRVALLLTARQGQEDTDRPGEARNAQAQEIQAQEIQAQEIQAQEIQAQEIQAQEIVPETRLGEARDPRAQETAHRQPVRIDLLLAHPEQAPPSADLVDPDLPTAARWFLDNARIPKQQGFQVVRERARFTCANPECRRRTLRCDAHHVVFRSKGGSDDPDENGLCVCRACHLRLIHTGRVQVDRVAPPEPEGQGTVGMLWTWSDRQVWVA